MGQDHQKVKSNNISERNREFRHSCFRTDNHNPLGREVYQELNLLQGPNSIPSPDLAKSAPGQGHRTRAPFVLSTGSLRKPWIKPGPPIVIFPRNSTHCAISLGWIWWVYKAYILSHWHLKMGGFNVARGHCNDLRVVSSQPRSARAHIVISRYHFSVKLIRKLAKRIFQAEGKDLHCYSRK